MTRTSSFVARWSRCEASPSGGKDRAADIKKLGPHVVMEDATAGLIETEQARELVEAVNEQLGSESIQFYPAQAIDI